MTLKVIGANPVIYHILKQIKVFIFNKTVLRQALLLKKIFIPKIIEPFIFLFYNFFNKIIYISLKKLYKIYSKIHINKTSWFTKNKNLEKLYVSAEKFFFSAGILLIYNKTPKKFLKKKFKTWILYITFFKQLNTSPAILFFKNLFSYKFMLINKIISKKINYFWIFIKLFYLNFVFVKKPIRRIKKWVKKAYFSKLQM